MSRRYVINGESLVIVKGETNAQHISEPTELGLTAGAVTISFAPRHKEVHVDDYGREVPAEVLPMMSTADIHMTLAHFDYGAAEECLTESMGGVSFLFPGGEAEDVGSEVVEYYFDTGGRPLGNGYPLYASGNHYVSVEIRSPVERRPWLFHSCYLTGQPVKIPLGSERTLLEMHWRAIPYAPLFDADGSLLHSGGFPANQGRLYSHARLKACGGYLLGGDPEDTDLGGGDDDEE